MSRSVSVLSLYKSKKRVINHLRENGVIIGKELYLNEGVRTTVDIERLKQMDNPSVND